MTDVMMSDSGNRELVIRLYDDVFNGELLKIEEIVAADYVDHANWKTRDGLRKTVDTFRKTYTDFHVRIEDMIAEGDKVVVRTVTSGGRNGKERGISSILIFRVADGKIVESWGHSDSFF